MPLHVCFVVLSQVLLVKPAESDLPAIRAQLETRASASDVNKYLSAFESAVESLARTFTTRVTVKTSTDNAAEAVSSLL